jgi:arylsulfatase A-like enzyme
VNQPVQITDWMPTFCAIAGYRPQTDLQWDGADITELLAAHAELPARPLYAVAPGWRARSLRWGNWKLIVHDERNSQRSELFNIAADPNETNNLASQEPDRVKQLQELLAAAAASDKDAVAKD